MYVGIYMRSANKWNFDQWVAVDSQSMCQNKLKHSIQYLELEDPELHYSSSGQPFWHFSLFSSVFMQKCWANMSKSFLYTPKWF
jgi:hypothetical protein